MGEIRSKCDLKKEVINWWWSLIPVSVMDVLWKLLLLLVRNTSMEVPDNYLKHVLLLSKFAKGKVSHRSDR